MHLSSFGVWPFQTIHTPTDINQLVFFWVLLLQHLWIVVFNQNDLMKIIEIFSGRSTGQESWKQPNVLPFLEIKIVYEEVNAKAIPPCLVTVTNYEYLGPYRSPILRGYHFNHKIDEFVTAMTMTLFPHSMGVILYIVATQPIVIDCIGRGFLDKKVRTGPWYDL